MKNEIKPYANYFGGKSGNGTYQTIINHIPPHKVFCSFFLGNCGVYRHIKPAEIVMLNDIDKDVYNAWKAVFKDDYKHFLRNENALELLDFDIEMTFNPFFTLAEPKDYFIYLDPPYLKSSRKSQVDVYKHEMTANDHMRLLRSITRPEMQEYKIMISCYPNNLYDLWLSDWHYVDFYSTIRNGVALERIYMNYEQTGELHDYRYLGGNFREREKFKRIKTNLINKLATLEPQLRNSIVAEIVTSLNELNK